MIRARLYIYYIIIYIKLTIYIYRVPPIELRTSQRCNGHENYLIIIQTHMPKLCLYYFKRQSRALAKRINGKVYLYSRNNINICP